MGGASSPQSEARPAVLFTVEYRKTTAKPPPTTRIPCGFTHCISGLVMRWKCQNALIPRGSYGFRLHRRSPLKMMVVRSSLGAGHSDLVVIDEADRWVFQKDRAIFGPFDPLPVG
jgi:hypothetical protein